MNLRTTETLWNRCVATMSYGNNPIYFSRTELTDQKGC
uniref:Uncharacterized protein n=1 Tax=Rhizophora mucronata TaxID=61149 RepID=A0A2P2LV34_RHIMU